MTGKSEPNTDKLLKEVEELKQANENLIRYTFGITSRLDVTARELVRAGNLLFTVSDNLKAVVKQSENDVKK